MKNIALVFAATLSMTAYAGDAQVLSCSGVAELHGRRTENIALNVMYRDQRASDGKSRKQIVRLEYDGKFYQGSYINKENYFPEEAPLVLRRRFAAIFRGRFTLDAENGESRFRLRLTGKFKDDVNFNTLLDCSDIST